MQINFNRLPDIGEKKKKNMWLPKGRERRDKLGV